MLPFSVVGFVLIVVGVWGSAMSLRRSGQRF